jgi:uncharacterized protein YabE (DUF348 family)/3D (Asp-Asp-Asp) domain-containing protein
VDLPPRSQKRTRVRPTPGVKRRFVPPTNPLSILIILVIAFGVIAIGSVYVLTAQVVTVFVNGNRYEVRTHQTTVETLMAELQLPLNAQDIVAPPANTALRTGLTVNVTKANLVIVDVDSKQQRLFTQQTQPSDILVEAGIKLEPDDRVETDNVPLKSEKYAAAPHHLQVQRAIDVTLDDNGTKQVIRTTRHTIGEVLADAKVALYLADTIQPDPSQRISQGMVITIQRSVPITVAVDGQTLRTRTHAKTVGGALAEVGLALVGLDYVQPEATTPITANMEVRIVRVSDEDQVEQTPIDFKREIQADPTLPIDTEQIVQEGIVGIQERRVRIRREDGVEVSRSTGELVVVQQPRSQITAMGTLPTLKKLDTPDGPVQYWRVIKMRVASYMPSSVGKSPDDPTYGMTATGEKLKKGLVAVDPRLIPLKSSLYIPGYGKAVAADTGASVQGRIIDLGYSDDDYQEWNGTVDVYLLPPVPSPEDVPLLPKETP